jgi:membrane-bound lytic murein transglycosylase B
VGSCASRTGPHRREHLGASLFTTAHLRAKRLEVRRRELSTFAQLFQGVRGDNELSKGSCHEEMSGMPQRAAASI